jgi:hypothetical protein
MARSKKQKKPQQLVTLKADGIPWNMKPVPPRIIAVGDVHGDVVGLSCILLDRGLINKKGRWNGINAHLVLNGDLVGGRNARLLLQFVMRLEKEAQAAGGMVHPLLGNHDIQVFQKEYQDRKGKTLFQKYDVQGADKAKLRDAFSGETEFAAWLRERNAVIKIGPTIFTHAGLNVWARDHHIKRMNATIRGWIRFWQGVDIKPERGTQWVALGPKADWSAPSTGPLWTRSYKVKKLQKGKKTAKKKKTAPDLDEFSRLLKKYNAKRMVVGHAPVGSEEVLLSHPLYRSSVVMIDTKISDKKSGRLSCIEITGRNVKAHYTKRSSAGEKVKDIEMKALKQGN